MTQAIAICQPNFLPWLGYFEMADRVDTFVMLDDVQYVRREWMNRNRFLSNSEHGWQWLSVPLVKSPRETLIRDMVPLVDEGWRARMTRTLLHSYARTPFFDRYVPEVFDLIMSPWESLASLNVATIRLIASWMEIPANLVMASDLDIPGRKDEKLAAICEYLGTKVYLANAGSRPYIKMSTFHQRGIGFVFQDYRHPVYSQGDRPFVSHLSALDALFWHGPRAREIMLSGRDAHWRAAISWPGSA